MSAKIQRPKLLIVEGRDEEMFFEAALANHLGIGDIQVMPIGGKTRLTANLAGLVNDPLFSSVQCLGIVRDADATAHGSTVRSAATALQSVWGSLAHVGLPCPSAHGQFGAGPPRVGVFIVPNGVDDGMLETLCVTSVSSAPEFHCVDDYFQCLQGHAIISNSPHKARAHAWLASRPDPGKRVGEAAQAGYWPWDSGAFAEIWSFIRSL